MKKKIIFVVTLLLIAGLTCFLIFKLRSDDNSKIQNDEFYAVVRESYAGYALVKPLDEDVGYDILSVSVKNLKVGDIIRLKVKNIKEMYPPEAEVLEVEVLQTDKISDLDGNDTIIEEITTTKSAERVSNETTNKVTTTTKIISTTTKTTTKKNDNKSADDEGALYTYEGVDAENGQLLSAFLDYVEELSKQQRVLVTSDDDCEFDSEQVTVKIKDKFCEIFRMYGQGSWTSIDLLDKEPDYAFVKIYT